MMTRYCAGRAGKDCLVSPGTRTTSGNSRLRREGQAGCRGAIGHPDCRRHRSPEKSPVSGTRGNGSRRPRIGCWRYSLCRVVPGSREEGDHPNDLARSATRNPLIENRVFQNEETKNNGNLQYLWRCRFLVALASRRRFLGPFDIGALRDSNPTISRTPSPLLSLGRSARMNGRS
jgi:hypothetical protein